MVSNPPPIQEQTTEKSGLFPQAWIRWFNEIRDRLDALEAVTIAKTSFSETVVAQNYPFIQAGAQYNLIPANFRTFTASGGAVTAEDRLFKMSTGTTSGGYAAIQSFRNVSAREGQSIMGRFSGYFVSNVANSWQGIGFIAIGDELSFGYSGTDFGIWHRYGGLPEVRTITVTGASGGSTNLTLTLNSVAYTIPLTAGTVEHNAYEITDWLNDTANQTIWKADNVDDTVIISAQADGAKSGTYSFSHATATGSIAQDTAGVTKTSEHIPQSSWNGGTIKNLDPSKGNVYQIAFQNMGWGEALFYIEDPTTAEFTLVHTLRITNQQTTRLLGDPSMRTGAYCVSLGSTTDLVVRVDSFSAFLQGNVVKTRNPRSIANTQTLSTTNETTVLAIRNRRTYNGYANQIEIEPLLLTVANEINKNVIFRLRATQDPAIELDFTAVGTNLISDYSGDSQTFTGGRLLDSIIIEPTGGDTRNLKNLEISVPPSLYLIVTAERTGGTSGDVTASLTWYEDV